MTQTTIYMSAEEAEEAFYEAINGGDIDALMLTWCDEDEIVCIHPTGQRVEGAAAIYESWRGIFESNPRFSMHIHSKVSWESSLISVHSVVETLFLEQDRTQHSSMLSTNVFIRGIHGWRLLFRHTSAAAEATEKNVETPDRKQHTLH